MKKHQTEFKLKVVKQFLDGEGGAKLLSRQWSVQCRPHGCMHSVDRASSRWLPICRCNGSHPIGTFVLARAVLRAFLAVEHHARVIEHTAPELTICGKSGVVFVVNVVAA